MPNSAFAAFYKESEGREVPRETRLEKLVRFLKVSSEMAGKKTEMSRIDGPGMVFWGRGRGWGEMCW